MRRRTILAGAPAALAWPSMVRAQERMLRVAVLVSSSETDPEGQARINGLRDGLKELGWIEGRNIHLDVKFGEGDSKRIRDYVVGFVADTPDLIVVNSTPALDEVYKATKTIPVVFMLAIDPVRLGYIQSLARPGANITGFTFWDVTLVGKWLQLLKEAAPAIEQVTFIHHPINTPYYPAILKTAESLPGLPKVKLLRVELREPGDIEPVIRSIAREPNASLVAPSDPFLLQNRAVVAAAALAAKLPMISIFRSYAPAGALMTYGPDTADIYRQSASYVDRILKGARPGDLPAQAPTKYEFVINTGTARKLGLALSPTLLGAADEVIE